MHKHTAKQDEAGVYALHRDDRICLCPKLMYPQVKAFQKSPVSPVEYMTELSRLPCTTDCPFAEIKQATNTDGENQQTKKDIYQITCEGGCRQIVLDEIIPFTKPPVTSPLQVVDK